MEQDFIILLLVSGRVSTIGQGQIAALECNAMFLFMHCFVPHPCYLPLGVVLMNGSFI